LIIEYAQQATGNASKLFCAVIGAAVLGLVMSAVVVAAGLPLRKFAGNRG
jgi:NitT/TauT family transport system permease protein